MLYVKTKISPSPIHGLGIFAEELIPKDTVIWKFTPEFDLKFTREQILNFPAILQIYICKYSWKSSKSQLYCFSSDNGKYCNYSSNPNAASRYVDDEDEVVTIALRDIQVGEEITDDYSNFESAEFGDNVLDEIAKRYNLVDELDPRLKK